MKTAQARTIPTETTLYGWEIGVVGDGVLDADGKATKFRLVKNWTHKPGDIIESRDGKSKYMVRTDRSLRKISE